jgi:hypothetical protein
MNWLQRLFAEDPPAPTTWPTLPQPRPVVAKIVRMLELRDYKYEYNSGDVYTFALGQDLSASLHRCYYYFIEAPDRYNLWVGGSAVDLTEAESGALHAHFMAMDAEADRRKAAELAAAIAKIEAYEPVDRRATQ